MSKKLIEVALPLNAINEESLRRKQKAPKGFPTSFHKWWAQRPLAACRAVLFASLIDDPSSRPDKFPTEKDQNAERERLLNLIEDLIKWENSNDKSFLGQVHKEIIKSTNGELPLLYDPFCGGGSIPLEAQRLGLKTLSSDINPVAVLINKALIEIPPKFSGLAPVNPESRKQSGLVSGGWYNTQGLAVDVQYYSQLIREMAKKRIGHFYPNIKVDENLVKNQPELSEYIGQELTVIAWIWARTVKSPNPAYANVDVPLTTTFMLSSKNGREVYIQPIIHDDGYHFEVRVGKPNELQKTQMGTKAGSSGSSFLCLMSGTPISFEYIRREAKEGRMGQSLMAIVAEGKRGRVYLSPTMDIENIARNVHPSNAPETDLPKKALGFRVQEYGMTKWQDLFTQRQLLSLITFTDLITEVRNQALFDAVEAGLTDDGRGLDKGGVSATAYADSIAIYLACITDRMAYYGSSLTTWLTKDNALRDGMPRQALAMTWDFAECNPFGKSSGDVSTCAKVITNYLEVAEGCQSANVFQQDARVIERLDKKILFSTDPPYYDNIGYADLSDFFYVWLRRSLKSIYPELFSTMAVPKTEELVATPFRHKDRESAEKFFLDGMTMTMERLADHAHPEYPVTIYYAFKQSETDDDEGTVSTGWETFIEAVMKAGFTICGTWPIRTEGAGRMVAKNTNALASSIVLVCRTREKNAPVITRREFLNTMKTELPPAFIQLQKSNIAPVDLAQAAIGPGMGIFSRYSKIIDAKGEAVTVREALSLINQMLDEVLTQQEGDFDAESRWALAWFEQFGFNLGEYGVAETLSKAKNTSVLGMMSDGILFSKNGKVRLFKPEELSPEWNPDDQEKLTVWEITHQLIRVLQNGGEQDAAKLKKKLGNKADAARELAYRLFTICERKKRAKEALIYNSLVQSWPEMQKLLKEVSVLPKGQTKLSEEE